MHRTLISKYPIAGGRDIAARMAKKGTLQSYHAHVARRLRRLGFPLIKQKPAKASQRERIERVPALSYNVGKSQKKRINIAGFLLNHLRDPATQVKSISVRSGDSS